VWTLDYSVPEQSVEVAVPVWAIEKSPESTSTTKQREIYKCQRLFSGVANTVTLYRNSWGSTDRKC